MLNVVGLVAAPSGPLPPTGGRDASYPTMPILLGDAA